MGSGIAVNATYSLTCGASGRRKFKGPLARTAGDANVDATAQRRELRRQLAEKRRALTPAQRIAAAQGLRRSLEQLPEYLTDARVAGYWACDGELPLNLIIPPLTTRGQEFLLPVIGPNHELKFAPWQSGEDVQPNRYGIPEPSAPRELLDRKSTRLNSSHLRTSRMPSSA